MKNAIILHGAGETPESFWIPYVRQKLTERERVPFGFHNYRILTTQILPNGFLRY